MKFTRRSVLKGAGAGLGTAFAASLFPQVSKADDEIVIASLFDQSGGLDIYGTPMTMTCELAVEELNAAGGLNGKKIRLIKYDPQSNMQLYAQYAQEAALKEKVDLVHGAITSASREVIRPILSRYKTLLWYSVIYEGSSRLPNSASSTAAQRRTISAPTTTRRRLSANGSRNSPAISAARCCSATISRST